MKKNKYLSKNKFSFGFNIRNKVKSKKGFTLVEVIVSMIIVSLIIAAIAGVTVPSLKIHAKAVEMAEVNNLLDSISNIMIDDISIATNIDLINNKITTNYENVIFTLDNGIIKRNGVEIFEKDFYKRKSASFSLSKDASQNIYTLSITITSQSDSSVLASRDYVIKPIVLNQY